MFAPKVRRNGQSLPCVRQRSGGAVLNDSPGGCQTRAVTEPQRDGGICEANDGEVFKTATFKPLSRARKERAPGIPRGMMRGKCAHWLAMTRLFGNCTRGAGQSPQYVV